MAEKQDRDTAAGMPGPVKTENAVAMDVTPTEGAKLPQVVAAALAIARRNVCNVTFRWLRVDVVVRPSDTYQGVQRNVQRLLNPDKKKA